MLALGRLLRSDRPWKSPGRAQDGHHARRSVWCHRTVEGAARGADMMTSASLDSIAGSPADATASAPPMIEVRQISKRFGPLEVLSDVSLKLPPGSFRALLGENGAGKSTLVKCIMGTYRADAGTVRVGAHEVELKNPRQAHA